MPLSGKIPPEHRGAPERPARRTDLERQLTDLNRQVRPRRFRPGRAHLADSKTGKKTVPLGPPALEPAVDDRAEPGTVITAIFESPETVHQPIRRFAPPDYSDNSAHKLAFFLSLPRRLGSRSDPRRLAPLVKPQPLPG